jgi:APA family basic amino acid/polyamine antiporter
MIGTGVFTTSGFLLADLKSPGRVLAVWVAGGVMAMLGALSYGALARRLPESGGEYLFLSRTLHPVAGYIAGWVSLLVGFSAPLAAAAIGFGEYMSPFAPGIPPRWSGTGLVLLFTLVHLFRVRHGAWVQNAAVVVKVFLIGLFVVYGLGKVSSPAAAASPVPATVFGVSLVWVSFSYSGWNAAIYVGGEIRDPERTLPRSLLLGTVIVTLLYVCLNAVFLYSTPAEKLTGQLQVGRIAAETLGGPLLANGVALLVALALLTSVSSLIMAGPRVYAQMAQDGFLPRQLAAGTDSRPPREAILLQTALALLFLWTATYQTLLTYIGFTLGLSTAATVVGLILLRRREGPRLHVPGWPWVPVAFVLAVLAMTSFTVARLLTGD